MIYGKMACPYFLESSSKVDMRRPSILEKVEAQEGFVALKDKDLSYSTYLQTDTLLTCQKPLSGSTDLIPIHDEHLFIITHQSMELWFKQILHEIDSVRAIFMSEYLEERNSLTIISRINRVVSILKHCGSHFGVLATMTPQDFLNFRHVLGGGSGFQSFQFRVLEIKLGVKDNLRVAYNKSHFLEVFFGEDKLKLQKAMKEPTLLELVNDWLERTPGIRAETFDFWRKFKCSVEAMLDEIKAVAEEEENLTKREHLLWKYQRRVKQFDELFNEKRHNELMAKDERRFTHQALKGALMIFFYRDEPRFHLPFQLLQSFMDVDEHFMKFRYDHTCMVQRMIGSKVGSKGSGYHYLRSTCSDRYKIFLDLFNLATYLVPRDRIPPLTSHMKRSLSIHDCAYLVPPNFYTISDERDSGMTAGTSAASTDETSEDERSLNVENKEGKLDTAI